MKNESLDSQIEAHMENRRIAKELAKEHEWCDKRIRDLAAELADSRLIAREQEDAHIAANMRNTHLQERIRELEAALREAKEIVKVFHDMGVPKHVREELWQLYQQSPEMKRLNAALPQSETDGECQEHKWERIAINNAKSPADPPEWVYTPYKCVRCGAYQSKIKGDAGG